MRRKNGSVFVIIFFTAIMSIAYILIARDVKNTLRELNAVSAQILSTHYSAVIIFVFIFTLVVIVEAIRLIERKPDMFKYDVPVALMHDYGDRVKVQQEKNLLYSAMVQTLSNEYETVYFVNMDTEDYLQYSMHKGCAVLLLDDHRHYFFTEICRYLIRKADKNDMDMLSEAINRENIEKTLEDNKQFTIKFRSVKGGVTSYYILKAMNFISADTNHIVVGIKNLNASIQSEVEYKEAVGQAIELAVIDELTGVKNRNAYVKREHELEMEIEVSRQTEFAFVMLDVNGLKYANDTFGHKAGDTLLKDASALICDVFKGDEIYRIGGDEFTVILLGDSYKNRHSLLSTFRARVHENAGNGKVVIASGMAEYVSGADTDIESVFDRADANMYKNKLELKAVQV